MRYSVRLNDQAAEDLAEIVLFIARDNPAAAEKLGIRLGRNGFKFGGKTTAREKGTGNAGG